MELYFTDDKLTNKKHHQSKIQTNQHSAAFGMYNGQVNSQTCKKTNASDIHIPLLPLNHSDCTVALHWHC
jgi:hypothetical protein